MFGSPSRINLVTGKSIYVLLLQGGQTVLEIMMNFTYLLKEALIYSIFKNFWRTSR
jgi:hypothetical protein